jgi:hypothetical protein
MRDAVLGLDAIRVEAGCGIAMSTIAKLPSETTPTTIFFRVIRMDSLRDS